MMAVGQVIGQTKDTIQVRMDDGARLFPNTIRTDAGDFVLISDGKIARRLDVEYA